jgi:HSP20 family protein
MNITKESKNLINTIEDKVEKGLEVAKDTLSNVVKHLPFANFAKHSKDTVDLEIDLPGVKKEDISIDIEGKHLTVTAVRNMKNEVKEKDYYLCESSFGQISRSFILPENIDTDKIDAKYEDGRLYITLEKHESQKPKSISVK